MKQIKSLAVLFFVIAVIPLKAQHEETEKMKLLDLKLQLIDSKLALLDSKIKIWETKPREIELTLSDLDTKVSQLNFDPQDFNRQFRNLDSLITAYKKLAAKENIHIEIKPEAWPDHDSAMLTTHRYAIALNPVRIFEGTMEISLEYKINHKNTLEISGMATYANSQGISSYYLGNQSLEYYNKSSFSYDHYTSENLSGFGATFQWKNYLLPAVNVNYYALKGLYAAPYAMYRRVWITGKDRIFNDQTDLWEEVDIVQKLNIMAMGVIAGWQFPVAKVISIDCFIGGVIRLSHYDTESGFTKYKKWDNIDYSGVLPRAGIKIGIIK